MTTLYLSPQGCDTWSGRLAQPTGDRSDGPLATPGAALLAARRRQAETRKPVHVVVGEGDYELAQPLVFTPEDSGQVWSAAPGARPVFSGGRHLSGWQVGEHAGCMCWTLDLPEVRAGTWSFTQLWVNGARRPRTRLPKTGFFRFTGLDGQANSGVAWTRGPIRAQYQPGNLQPFMNLDDVSLVVYQLWFDTHHRIQSLDETAHVVHFHRPSLGSLLDEKAEFARYVLFNVFEGLSEPGEWYLDRSAGRLYYLPLPGEVPEQTEVVASRLVELVRFQSSDDTAVADIRLENLTLAHNEWSRGKENVGSVQAATDVSGAVVFDRAERCVLYGCEISHCAGYGVEMLTGSHANVVAACTIRDLGGGGIKIGHESLTVHETAVGQNIPPVGRWFRRQAATVADCQIHDGGHVYPSAIGVWIGNAGGNRIQHNEIHHFNYTGISFGWVWGYAPSSRGFDNRIENNHIHHINDARLLSDNGGIYSLGLQSGSVVTGNHIHDVSCHGYGGWGLYPDEGSSGILYRDNCVHDVKECGLCVHYGRFLTIRNNLFARVGRDILGLGRSDLSCGNVFEQNVLWFDHGNLGDRADRDALTHITRRNVIWNAGVGGVHWPLGSLAAEQAEGRWLESIEADPLLTDPAGGDFSLRAESPALGLGFAPFDWRQAGPRPANQRSPRFEEYRVPEAKPIAALVARLDGLGTVTCDEGYQVSATLVVENVSALPASGVYQIVAKSGGPRVREWPLKAVAVSVSPGEAVRQPISFPFPAGERQVWLMALGDERVLFSGAVLVRIPAVVALPDLGEGQDESECQGLLLQAGAPVEIVHGSHSLLTARVAVAGDRLLVSATIAERNPQPNVRMPWMGSSLELFLASDGDPASKVMPKQFFMLPPVDGCGGTICGATGAAPDQTRFEAQLTPEGWALNLVMPLAGAGIERVAGAFRFDLICNARSPVSGQNLLHLPVWGMANDHADAALLARAVIK